MKKFNSSYNNIYIYIILITLFIIIIKAIIAYTTYFTKTITIKNISYYRNGKSGYNLVEDENGIIYNVQNTIFYLFFQGAELYASLENNKKYQISGYGIRIPFLGWYPHIIKAIKIN